MSRSVLAAVIAGLLWSHPATAAEPPIQGKPEDVGLSAERLARNTVDYAVSNQLAPGTRCPSQ